MASPRAHHGRSHPAASHARPSRGRTYGDPVQMMTAGCGFTVTLAPFCSPVGNVQTRRRSSPWWGYVPVVGRGSWRPRAGGGHLLAARPEGLAGGGFAVQGRGIPCAQCPPSGRACPRREEITTPLPRCFVPDLRSGAWGAGAASPRPHRRLRSRQTRDRGVRRVTNSPSLAGEAPPISCGHRQGTRDT
jgi:hypothetical protein